MVHFPQAESRTHHWRERESGLITFNTVKICQNFNTPSGFAMTGRANFS